MPRHLINIVDLVPDDIDQLFDMADQGPKPGSLAGLTCLSVFFQESTRTRLGFLGAAARQGAAVLDAGSVDRLRLEPRDDQQMVLAGIADIVIVRHWDEHYARDLASRGLCAVLNAGCGGASHPTQSLVDAYTLTRAFERDLTGLRVLFLGPLLRSALSFLELAAMLGVDVAQCDVSASVSPVARSQCQAEILAADVVYVQSLSDTSYTSPDLNLHTSGPPLPDWTLEAIVGSRALIMHALPRGAELPDSLMRSGRSLVSRQVEQGMPVRSSILRWLVRVP
jgi:aspartate carbamoyltransferase catalytic subunit